MWQQHLEPCYAADLGPPAFGSTRPHACLTLCPAAESAFEIDQAAVEGRQGGQPAPAFCAPKLLSIMERCLEVRFWGRVYQFHRIA